MNDERMITDLQLAAFLVARDFRIVRIISGRGERKVFVFQGVTEQDLADYYGDVAKVSARKLYDAYRDLRGFVAQQF